MTEMIKKSCVHCGKQFTDHRKNVMLCSVHCAGERNKFLTRRRNEEILANAGTCVKKCLQCGQPFETRKKTVVCCSNQCKQARQSALVQQRATRRGRFLLFQRDNFQCIYCGSSPRQEGVYLTIDHIFPLSHGGDSIASNLVTACEYCNKSKHDNLLPLVTQAELLAIIERRNLDHGISPQTRIVDVDRKRVYARKAAL